MRGHKLKRDFQDSINSLCNCGSGFESTSNFFVHSPFFINERCTLLNTISDNDTKLLDNSNSVMTQTLLSDNEFHNLSSNSRITGSTEHILST